jgi:hypothetical protein
MGNTIWHIITPYPSQVTAVTAIAEDLTGR